MLRSLQSRLYGTCHDCNQPLSKKESKNTQNLQQRCSKCSEIAQTALRSQAEMLKSRDREMRSSRLLQAVSSLERLVAAQRSSVLEFDDGVNWPESITPPPPPSDENPESPLPPPPLSEVDGWPSELGKTPEPPTSDLTLDEIPLPPPPAGWQSPVISG